MQKLLTFFQQKISEYCIYKTKLGIVSEKFAKPVRIYGRLGGTRGG